MRGEARRRGVGLQARVGIRGKQKLPRGAEHEATGIQRVSHVKREDVFARDEYRCVYCGLVQEPERLSVDHVQPRVSGGDRSGGNLVSACTTCNTRKGHRKLARFLADEPAARDNFFKLALHVWPRHLRAVEEELERIRRTAG